MILVILLALLVAMIAMLKFLGMRAQRIVYIEVTGLTMEEIIDIGTKKSEAAWRRLRGRAKTFTTPDGDVGWNAKTGGGVVTFLVRPLPDGSGYRVGAASLAQKAIKMYGVADLTTDYGRTKFWLYKLMWRLGVPHNPRALLYRRWKGLRAIRRAGTPIVRTPVDAPSSAPSVGQ